MYASDKKNQSLLEPAESDILWRYQTICKFQSIVKEKALFFCRLDKLNDPREGTLPSATADAIRDFLTIPNKNEGIRNINEVTRAITAVNCWNLSDYENALMWSSYANPGVAIKTTFASLKNSLKLSIPRVEGSIVKYLDHDKDDIVRILSKEQGKLSLSVEMATLKYRPFEGEKEFRLISNLLDKHIDGNTGTLIELKRTDNGIFVGVNLYSLLHEVVLSPGADDELESRVWNLIEPINDGLPLNSRIPVSRSTLYA